MAVEIKLAPDEKLELVRAQITDTSLNSDYFNVTELSDTFSGGKNAFLIAGSELLEPNTEVKVQIRDSAGKVLYCEFSDGSPDEYYEGISKVVAVYVYPTETSFGPATITLVGQIRDTLDLVKWQRTINIDPSLPNTTRVRFYKRPIVSIVEELSPIYTFDVTGSKLASNITQSFANIKVSQLDTFAGDVKRVKVYRTSEGDISDYDLIQDILVESKELLTTTTLSGSVVGQAGLFTSETLQKLWIPTGVTTQLTSSKIDNGVKLSGSGYFTYSSSLDIKSANTYELGIDAFYSSSTSSNIGIYLSQVTTSTDGVTPLIISSSIGTLIGTQPTKNLSDTTLPFKINKDYPSASLYLSQSQGEWHVGNISLKLSEDSAFSPSEISFVTSMPTVIGNETYNFKFEFYDVNNNYVPVAVTQSALFTGGNNNVGGTLIFISESNNKLSSSVGYDLWFNPSGSVTASITTVSGSVSSVSASISGTISTVSSSLSSSISSSKGAAISSSFGNIQTLANGNFSGSFISDTTIFAPVIGGNNGYISDLFKVGTTPSIYLDARQNPRKIFIGGVGDVGSYNSGSTTVYMDSTGKFSLGNKLTWDGGSLTLAGSINITGGQAATDIANAASSGSNALNYAITNNATASAIAAGQAATTAAAAANYALVNANTASISAARDAAGFALINANTASIFTDTSGKVNRAPSTGTAGLYLGNEYMGYHNGNGLTSGWKTYMQNNGNFFLSGTNGFLSWNAVADTLAIKGDVTATNITATNSGNIAGWSIDGSSGLSKSNGVHTISLNSTDAAYYIRRNSTNQLKVKISPDTTILPITINAGTTDSINYQSPGEIRFTVTGTGTQSATTIITATSGRGDGPFIGYAGTGIIYLENPTEEIWVDSDGEFGLTLLQFLGTISVNGNSVNTNDDVNASYSLTLVAEKYASWTDARDRINRIQTYRATIAQTGLFKFAGEAFSYTDYTYNISGGGFQVDSNQNWFYVYLEQKMDLRTSDWVGIGEEEELSISMIDYGASIKVQFGRVDNGYSQLSPAGLQVYTGVRTYMNASVSGVSGENFFEVKGKSQFLSGLSVNGTFSASSKQFQITHPLNKNKWLYHTAIEGPQADLIYRGKLNLINGEGSCNIDVSSRLTNGTFNSLTRNPQLFLQNNDSFDRIKGKIENGNVYVVSENENSSASVDWTVIAERCDTEILTGGTYGGDGKYKTEKWKREFYNSLMITGSI